MKTLIITHKADIDGLSPIIFLKLIRENVDYSLLNANESNDKIKELISSKAYKNYDEIFVTDLQLDANSCELIMSTKEVDKFHTFDHHSSNLISNNYPFGTAIVESEDGVKQCATSLFYQYLCGLYPDVFDNDCLRTYTEYVRLNDTWDWARTNNLEAKKLDTLHSIIGRDEYIEYFTNFLKNEKTFHYTDKQEYLFQVEDGRIKRYLEETEKTLFIANLHGMKCGVVFAEQNRSLLGNYLCEKYSYLIDYIVIINMQQGLSFRTCKEGINVSEIASFYGGGGHVKASGAPMDNTLKKEIVKQILKDNKMFNKQY